MRISPGHCGFTHFTGGPLPAVGSLRYAYGVRQGAPGVRAPLHAGDRARRGVSVAMDATPPGRKLRRPRQGQRALDDLLRHRLALRLALRRIIIADEGVGCGVVARPQLLGGDDYAPKPLDVCAAHRIPAPARAGGSRGPWVVSPRRRLSPCPGDACRGRRPPIPGSPGRGTACPQGWPRRSLAVCSPIPIPLLAEGVPSPAV